MRITCSRLLLPLPLHPPCVIRFEKIATCFAVISPLVACCCLATKRRWKTSVTVAAELRRRQCLLIAVVDSAAFQGETRRWLFRQSFCVYFCRYLLFGGVRSSSWCLPLSKRRLFTPHRLKVETCPFFHFLPYFVSDGGCASAPMECFVKQEPWPSRYCVSKHRGMTLTHCCLWKLKWLTYSKKQDNSCFVDQ